MKGRRLAPQTLRKQPLSWESQLTAHRTVVSLIKSVNLDSNGLSLTHARTHTHVHTHTLILQLSGPSWPVCIVVLVKSIIVKAENLVCTNELKTTGCK